MHNANEKYQRLLLCEFLSLQSYITAYCMHALTEVSETNDLLNLD